MAEGFTQLSRIDSQYLNAYFVSNAWELAREKLAVSIYKHCTCVLSIDAGLMSSLTKALDAFHALTPEDLQRLRSQNGSLGFSALPGRHQFDYKVNCAVADELSFETMMAFDGAFATLDVLARLVLNLLCRASHVRLPTTTFAALLDETPVMLGAPVSSLLQVVQWTNNLTSSPANRSARRQWTLVHQQKGVPYPGLLTLVLPKEAQDCHGGLVSKLQVKDASGSWIDVVLQENEVAIFLGATAERATGGLLKAATTCVVGELVTGMPGQTQRESLEFHLHARPDAVLDPAPVLQEAGHAVQASLATPVAVRELMRQFDRTLTPLSDAPGSTGGSLEFGAFGPALAAAGSKRNRRRATGGLAVASASSPVTRSGKVRRTSGALVTGEPMPGEDPSCAGTGSGGGSRGGEDEEPPAGSARVYITVDGGRSTANFLRLRLLRGQRAGAEAGVWFRIDPHALAARLFEAYSNMLGEELLRLKFYYRGCRIPGSVALADVGVGDGEEILVVDALDEQPMDVQLENVPPASEPDLQPLECEEPPL